jgi:hypothetical protein
MTLGRFGYVYMYLSDSELLVLSLATYSWSTSTYKSNILLSCALDVSDYLRGSINGHRRSNGQDCHWDVLNYHQVRSRLLSVTFGYHGGFMSKPPVI